MFELRQFEADDADAVRALHDAALDDAGVHGGPGPWEDDLRDIAATYLEPGGEFLVLVADGEVVGMGGLLRRSTEECEIKRMRVRPDLQRQGFGRRILKALEERARGLGFRSAVLDTTADQIAARRLYEAAGFSETGRRDAGRFVFIDFAKDLAAGASVGD